MKELGIKVILFDFDDTLVQTKAVKSAALKELGRTQFNKIITDDDLNRYWGLPYQEFMCKLFDIQELQIDQYLRNYRKMSLKYPQKAYPQTKELLATLSEKYQLGIITATSSYAVRNQLAELNIDIGQFEYLQTADDSTHHKPDPRVFDNALAFFAQRSWQTQNIVYVGDSWRDWHAARDAGLHFIGIAGHTTPAEQFESDGAMYVTQLLDLPLRILNLIS